MCWLTGRNCMKAIDKDLLLSAIYNKKLKEIDKYIVYMDLSDTASERIHGRLEMLEWIESVVKGVK